MSDKVCVKCQSASSYEAKVWFGPEGGQICGTCAAELRQKIAVLLNLDGVTSDEYGITLHWHEIVALLARSSFLLPLFNEQPTLREDEMAIGPTNERIAVRHWLDRDQQQGVGSEQEIEEALKGALKAEGFSFEGMEKMRDPSIRATTYFAWGLPG